MSSYRSRRLDRSTAERLLAGDQATTDTNADTAIATLAVVLRAAAAPARPHEFAGEHTALAAYSEPADLGPVPETRRPSMLKSALAKVLTVKAAIVVAVVGASGVALAASTDSLPWAGTPADPPATSRAQAPATPPAATQTGQPSDAGKPSETGKPADAGATPDPSMVGLCQAYEAQVGEDPGKALDSAAFQALIDKAGGRDEVPAYCDTVTKDHPTGQPSDLPTPTNQSGGNAPSTHPTPSNRPSTPASPTHPADPSGVATPHQG